MSNFEEEIPVWKTKIIKNEDYEDNYKQMYNLVKQLNERLEESRFQGEKKSIDNHLKRGQLLARERVELLLDEDSPFLELLPFVGYGQKENTCGGSIVAGIGLVCGIETLITASIPTLKGGTVNEATLIKGARIAEIAETIGLPSVNLLQSGGANLSQQERIFHQGGESFRHLAKRAKMCHPTVCVVFGNATAGGAYTPGLSSYTIMIKNKSKVFLGGPPLVKMATGEEVDDETLGGAEMHSKVSGVSDYLAQDEYDAIRMARNVVKNFNLKKKTPLPKEYFFKIEEPIYDSDELLGIVSANIRIPFDAREVIARIVDGSRFSEFKPLYGSTLVCCEARIHGILIGILANNGVLFSDSSNKGTQFIQLCNQRNIPLLFLQNITGFMVGKEYEKGGIIKHGSLMINAVSNSTVPAITIVIGASFGAGNYAMCGRSYHPRFLFSYPNSKCSVMGEEQLGGVMDIIMRQGAKKAGIQLNEKMVNARKQQFIETVKKHNDVYYTSSKGIDDGIIDPRDTRSILGICLSVIHNEEIKGDPFAGVSRL